MMSVSKKRFLMVPFFALVASFALTPLSAAEARDDRRDGRHDNRHDGRNWHNDKHKHKKQQAKRVNRGPTIIIQSGYAPQRYYQPRYQPHYQPYAYAPYGYARGHDRPVVYHQPYRQAVPVYPAPVYVERSYWYQGW